MNNATNLAQRVITVPTYRPNLRLIPAKRVALTFQFNYFKRQSGDICASMFRGLPGTHFISYNANLKSTTYRRYRR